MGRVRPQRSQIVVEDTFADRALARSVRCRLRNDVPIHVVRDVGTIVVILVIFGVRPGNFADWLTSSTAVVILIIVGVLVGWRILRGRRSGR